MTLLADTHILIAVMRREDDNLAAAMRSAMLDSGERLVASVASLWEIAIKVRLGKLPLHLPLANLPATVASLGFSLLPIDQHHVLAELAEQPQTRDPFDRLLFAQCQVENMRLVTRDAHLIAHPLAWQP